VGSGCGACLPEGGRCGLRCWVQIGRGPPGLRAPRHRCRTVGSFSVAKLSGLSVCGCKVGESSKGVTAMSVGKALVKRCVVFACERPLVGVGSSACGARGARSVHLTPKVPKAAFPWPGP
jgi:hypothetical protein